MNHPRLSLITILALSSACSYDSMHGSMEMGVTQGGAQDINLAREIIESGGIPDQSQFRSEGLFSEHDLPLSGDECELTLCPRTASARIVPTDDSGEALLVQIGFGSNIDADTYERRPQNLAVAIDISGSMGTEKMEAAKTALTVLVDQLDERDTLSIVAFDDRVDIISRPKTMDSNGRRQMKSKIEGLRSDGGTNIEAGLEEAFEQADKNSGQSGIEDRVMLLTDAQPNIGATDMSSFMGLTRHYADQGIGLSVFGVGMDLGAELATEMSTIRGGNSFFLADNEEIAEVFSEDFAFIVSPIAYDLDVEIELSAGWTIEDGYGIALDSPSAELEFGASTLFLSRRNGGMAAVLRHESGEIPDDLSGQIGRISASFDRADDSGRVEKETEIGFDGGQSFALEIMEEEIYGADQIGVFRMAALIDEYQALTAAADFCDGTIDLSEAKLMVSRAAARLGRASTDLEDEGLGVEAELMLKLRENLESPSCDGGMYGYY